MGIKPVGIEIPASIFKDIIMPLIRRKKEDDRRWEREIGFWDDMPPSQFMDACADYLVSKAGIDQEKALLVSLGFTCAKLEATEEKGWGHKIGKNLEVAIKYFSPLWGSGLVGTALHYSGYPEVVEAASMPVTIMATLAWLYCMFKDPLKIINRQVGEYYIGNPGTAARMTLHDIRNGHFNIGRPYRRFEIHEEGFDSRSMTVDPVTMDRKVARAVFLGLKQHLASIKNEHVMIEGVAVHSLSATRPSGGGVPARTGQAQGVTVAVTP